MTLDTPAVEVHLVGEALRDDAIARVYGDGSLGAEVAARVGLAGPLEIGVDAGYRRLGGARVSADGAAGATTWFWYVPVSVKAGAAVDAGPLTLAAGLGPTAVVWAEEAGTAPGIGYRGVKLGLVVEGEARLDPRALAPTMHDLDGLDLAVVAGAGWRWTARSACDGAPCGLDLGALRVSVGVSVGLP